MEYYLQMDKYVPPGSGYDASPGITPNNVIPENGDLEKKIYKKPAYKIIKPALNKTFTTSIAGS